jgi:glycosyltransferase involved in cell wall biosynthesis
MAIVNKALQPEERNTRQLKASVCICTYNGASRIGAVLEALVIQTAPRAIWELLIIDNASTDGTCNVANRLIEQFLGGHGRVIAESRPGLSFARARAGREARGEVL